MTGLSEVRYGHIDWRSLILSRGFLDMVDHQKLYRAALLFELEAELFLYRSKNRRTRIVGGVSWSLYNPA